MASICLSQNCVVGHVLVTKCLPNKFDGVLRLLFGRCGYVVPSQAPWMVGVLCIGCPFIAVVVLVLAVTALSHSI